MAPRRDSLQSVGGVCRLVAILALASAGCYDAGEVTAFVREPRLPVSATEYRILPPDELFVTSIRVPEVNAVRIRVRPDGKINLPLVGEIDAANRTPREIEEAIKTAATKYYQEVDATVQVAGFSSRRFYVFGQVSRPGAIAWTGSDTFLDAIAQAQPTALAWPERIVVIRGLEPTQGGYASSQPSDAYKLLGVHDYSRKAEKPKTMTVNLMAMVKHGDMSNNILLQPNDVIYVQPNPFAEVALGMERVFFPIRAATNGLSDYRELVAQVRWILDHQPRDVGAGRATIVTR